MTDARSIKLESRALVSVRGEEWRSFLQNILTCDVETLQEGQARFGALLTPQGRLLHDLFVVAEGAGALLDVSREGRDELLRRLSMYKLRARVDLAEDERPVSAARQAPNAGLATLDPRLPELGWRIYGVEGEAEESAYDVLRLALGVPDTADWGSDRTYPIEANFDLLNGIDFKKGCFVGQETTSRMKRRGNIKNRMAPIVFEDPPPPFGAEVLAGELRAGEVLSGLEGRAMALLRLDRIEGQTLTVDGRPVSVEFPDWLKSAIAGA